MCEVCGYRVCAPACPGYEGVSAEFGSPTGRCGRCGRYMSRSEIHAVSFGKPYCGDCAASARRAAGGGIGLCL